VGKVAIDLEGGGENGKPINSGEKKDAEEGIRS